MYIKNYSLASEACLLIIKELTSLTSSSDIKISYHALGLLVQEICSYAEQFGNKTIDPQFVKWLIMKYYSTNQK